MKRIILQQFVTIDGYAADLNGGMDFQQDYVARDDRSFQEEALRFLDTIDTMILGANTYKMFAAYWPEATDDMGVFAEKLNSLSKFVVSNSMESAPWGKWEPAEIISGNVTERIADLKAQSGKAIVVWGSLTLADHLMRNHLIDEFQLRVCPAALGDGIPVFAHKLNLRLLDAKAHDKGMVFLRYEPT